MRVKLGCWAAAGWIAAGAVTASELSDEQRAELARYFGFGPMQIYRIKPGIADLQIADLNADGKQDIALWNRWQNRIEILYQQDGDAPPGAGTLERNEVPDRGNMRRENVPVAYRVAALHVAELTGDQRPDFVFFGEPRDLVILPGKAEGGFGPPLTYAVPEGDPSGGSLTTGDFNGDGRTDVALKGEEQILVFHQEADGGLRKPERLVHGVAQAGLLLRVDYDGDGRDDLLLGAEDDQYGLLAFRQTPSGALGALERIRVPRTRSVTIAPTGKGGRDDIFIIEAATNRLRHLRWSDTDGEQQDWPLKLYSYPIFSRSKQRPVALGDVTGDGVCDVVAADPDSAQLVLFRGGADGLEPGVAFPGLLKTTEVQIADADGDGRPEVLSLSPTERTLGVSRYEDGRLSFPEPLAVEGEPLAFCIGSLAVSGGGPVTAVLTRSSGADGGRQFSIRLLGPDGAETGRVEVTKLEDDAGGLRLADVDQDGRNDLLLFVKFAPLRAYLQQADGGFRGLSQGEAEARTGLVKEAAIEDFATGDLDGDGKAEVLLAQKNLARALVVRDGMWQVEDQYNPESTDAKLKGIALLSDAAGPSLVMYDQNAGGLIEMRRRADGAFGVARIHRVGVFDLSALLGFGPACGQRGVLLADVRRLGLVQPGAPVRSLVEQEAYETDAKDAWLGDSVAADFNGDGIRDVAVIDIRKARIELLTTLPDGKLVRATHFQVFQGKRFSGDPDSGGEPRQVLAGDVTGDGIDDLVAIVHDRLIVYPGQ